MPLNFQHNAPAPSKRVLVVVFLAVSLILVTVYAREGEGGPLHAVQGAFGTLSQPFKYAGAVVGSGTDAAASSVENATAGSDTLEGLRAQNAELRELLSQADEYKQEAERLQGLVDLKDTYAIDGVAARVIGRNSDAWNQQVTIDKGSADGVDAGQTVMGPSGVVGQVIKATDHSADIRLLTDPNSGAAALIQTSRAEGMVRGSLEGLLYLEDLDNDVVVNVGDVIVTSGLGGSYTRGLIIGMVVKIDTKQGDSTRRIVVSPNDETGPLQEVLVVKSMGSEGAAAGKKTVAAPEGDAAGGGEGDGDEGGEAA